MKAKTLQKLPQELINQIAAGEVIERPSSVVKELLDNAIDAGADQIKIRVEEGGMKLIEVSDNGVGIEENSLSTVFDPHTTSKISSMEDLSSIMTMGFRGEALSTILSVAKVSISSKYEQSDVAHSLKFSGTKSQEASKTARNQGTTIVVEDLFYNIPARKKFLKTAETEYRKILETVTPYFLQYPNIHFILEKNGKEVYNLPKTVKTAQIEGERVKAVLKGDFTSKLISISAQGAGTKLTGLIGHPSLHQSKTSHQYIFINRRPIWDNGIVKSIHLGFGRFIPHGEKVPFIVSFEVNPDLVDVNVHPKKEEVKFINPFRVYSLVEEAVSKTLAKEMALTSEPYKPSFSPTYETQKPPQNHNLFDSSVESKPKEINFSKKASQFDVMKSLKFSKELLNEKIDLNKNIRNAFQLFNKYIVLEFENEMWMLDQHAAAERITFEKLSNSYNSKPQEIQNLLVPTEINASPAELSFISENIEFFNKLGFEIEVGSDKIIVRSTPVYFQQANIETIFKELWQLSDEERDMKDSFEKAKENILVTMSCHTSIRTGQALSKQEGIQLYNDLKKCINPYSCPHGRPIVWRMSLQEIDKNFDRTY